MVLLALVVITALSVWFSEAENIWTDEGELAALSRVFVPIKLRGKLLFRGSKIEAGIQCQANTILHEDIRPVPGREDVFWVPHSLIVQDGKRCGTGRSRKEFMTVVPGRSIIRYSTAKELGLERIYKELLSNRRALNAFGKLHAVDPVHIGFEMTAHRRCGNRIAYPRGSVFLFLSSSSSKLNLGFASFRVGQVGMVSVLNNQNLCAYQDDFSDNSHPHPKPSQTPNSSVTPGPSNPYKLTDLPITSTALNPSPPPMTSVSKTSSPSTNVTYPLDNSGSSSPIPSPSLYALPSASIPTSSVDPRKSRDWKCFPNKALVELRSGIRVPISSLKIGSEVKTGATSFSTVFMFTHYDKNVTSEFVRLRTAGGGVVTLSEGHFVKVCGKLIEGGKIRLGDTLETSTGESDVVISTDRVVLQGLHNPQTLDGSIVVDGFVMSAYTEAVSPFAAEALLLPLRTAYRLLKFCNFSD